MANFSRILFIDESNTDLSVMAETIMTRLKADREVEILSRGMVVLFPEPLNAKAEKVLQNHALKALTKESHELTAEDITDTTLILTMTEAEKGHILEAFSNANFVYTLREFAGEEGDLPEPHGDEELYEKCFARVLELVTSVADILFKE